jgi:ABC-type multidrug transport system fused ATPase/permease subunit
MRNLRPLWPYLVRHRFSLLFGLFILLILAGVNLTQPYLLRLGIDSFQVGRFEPVYCLLIFLVGVSQFGLGFLQRLSINRAGHLIEAEIRSDLFAKCQKLDRRFFDETSLGDLIVHSTSDVSIQRNFLNQLIISGFNTLFLGTMALGLMFIQNWRLAIIGVIFLPFLVWALAWIGRKTQEPYRASQEQLGEVSNRVQQVLGGIRVVKAFNRENTEIEYYKEENRRYVRQMLRFARWNNLMLPLIGLVVALITITLLWVGGQEVVANRLTLGQFVQFNAYLLLLTQPMVNLANMLSTAQQAAASMSRLQKIFLLEPAITDSKNDDTKEESQPDADVVPAALEFSDVGLRYGDHWVLRDINFRVAPGQTVAIVGPTGAGKSSLASLVGRVYDPQEGSIKLDGQDVRDVPLERLRRQVAYVPQETLLFSVPLRENVAFGNAAASDEEISIAADRSRLAQDLPQIPGGLDALVGERGVTLSGGQKQRSAIARALVPPASVLILDDALSSVDNRTQTLIWNNLQNLTGHTRLIVTQRLALVKDADWIIVLDGGRLDDQGTHAQLLARAGLYARMYRHEQSSQENLLSEADQAAFVPENPVAEESASEPNDGVTRPDPTKDTAKSGTQDEDEIVGGKYTGRRLGRLLGYVWRYWRTLLVVTPVVLGAALLELVGPLLSKIAIDEYITPRQLNGLELIILLFVASAFAGFGLKYFRTYLMQRLAQQVVRDLRVQLFDRLLRNSLAFFDRYPSGSLVGRLTSDMDAINELLGQGAVAIIADLVVLTAIVITMFLLDWRLALVSLAVLPILFGLSFYLRQILRRAWRTARRKYSVLIGYMAENYAGMLIVQLFNRQATSFARFSELNDDYSRSNRFIIYINGGVLIPLVSFLSSSANALLLLVGGWLLVQGGQTGSGVVTVGLLVAFLQYTERAFQPIRDLAERYTVFQAASTSTERIFGLLDYQPQVTDPPNPRPLVAHPNSRWAEVRFENVCFGYDPEHPVLKDLSFTVRAGEKVAIVGPTGAGKTSIVSLLGRHYDVQEGQITINGVDVRDVTQADLRRHLALVLQDPVLFKGTIAENIRLGNPELSDKAVREAARYVGADDFIQRLPGGYDYLLQERGSNISAGQRQLISFARALAYNPQAILILDEATSSVDSESEAIIQSALKKLLLNRTALIIAHRLSTIRDVDRVLVIERGQLTETGTQEELLSQRGLYFQLYSHGIGSHG